MKAYLAYCQNRRMQVKPVYLGFIPRALIAKANRGNLEEKVESKYVCTETPKEKEEKNESS